jgi:hypothetical protein
MTDQSYPYDVTFTTGGVTYGFMLTTPPGKSKTISIQEASPVPAYSLDRAGTQDSQSYQNFAPGVDTPFSMSTFAGGAGKLEFNADDPMRYLYSTGIVTHVDGKAYLAPSAASIVTGAATASIDLYTTYMNPTTYVRYDFAVIGTGIYRRPATDSTTAWTLVYTAAFAITDFRIVDGLGVICTPSSTNAAIDYLTQADVTAAATWTPTSRNHSVFSNGNKPKFIKQVRGTAFAFVDPNRVYFNVDITADTWLGPIDTSLEGNISGPPGDESYYGVGLHAVGDFLFIIKQDAIYSIDSQQEVLKIIWQWEDRPSEYNFKYFSSTEEEFIFCAANEVYVYKPTTGAMPKLEIATQDGFSTKEILGVTNDNQYIYVLAKIVAGNISSNTRVALFRYYKSGKKWVPEIVWEDISLTNKTYGRIFASPNGIATRVYWGLVTSAAVTRTFIMDVVPEWDETASSNFTSSATIYTSIARSGFPGLHKRHIYINMDALNLSTNNTIAIKYSIDDGATYTTLATGTSAETSSNYVNIESKSLILAFTLTSQNGTVTPVLKVFDHHQRVRFKYLEAIQIGVRIGRLIETRNRGKINDDLDTQWDNIKTLRTTEDQIVYKDFLGNSFNCSVDAIGVAPSRHQDVGDYEEEASLIITRADIGA